MRSVAFLYKKELKMACKGCGKKRGKKQVVPSKTLQDLQNDNPDTWLTARYISAYGNPLYNIPSPTGVIKEYGLRGYGPKKDVKIKGIIHVDDINARPDLFEPINEEKERISASEYAALNPEKYTHHSQVINDIKEEKIKGEYDDKWYVFIDEGE